MIKKLLRWLGLVKPAPVKTMTAGDYQAAVDRATQRMQENINTNLWDTDQ